MAIFSNPERKKARKLQKQLIHKTAWVVCRALNTERKKSILFPMVAQALGVPWLAGHGKSHGYALVMQYAEKHGLVWKGQPVPSKRRRGPRQVSDVAGDEFLASYEWRRLRMQIIKERGAKCECCGAVPTDGVMVINVDHIKPRRLFPALALEASNLQVLCHVCNHGKGNWDQTDWRENEPIPDPLRPRLVAKK